MNQALQLRIKNVCAPRTIAALALWTLALVAMPLFGFAFHVPGHIPPTGTCREPDCLNDKGTGETGGSNVSRDSKTKAPGNTKTKAPDCDGMRREVEKMCKAYSACKTTECQAELRENLRNASNNWAGSQCGQGSGIGCGGEAGLPGKTGGQSSPPGSTGGGGGGSGSGGGGSGGGGSGGFGGGRGGGSGGSPKGGNKAFLVPAKDLQGSSQGDREKDLGRWSPWKRGQGEFSQPGPGAVGSGSPWGDTPPLPKERLPEIINSLDRFGSVSEGNRPALNSILENARRESDSTRQAEILKAVLPLLITALRDPNAAARREAADALGKMGQGAAPAIPPLVEKLEDQDETVRKAASGAMNQIGQELAKNAPRENDRKRQAEMQKALGGLQNGEPSLRRQAAEKLGTMGRQAGPAIPELVHKLQDQDLAVRNAAAAALKNITRSFEAQNEGGAEQRRAALCMDLSWTGFQISAFSCDLAAR